MSTIRDIAKKASVSIATVSRVINGNYPVSEQVSDRVVKAIAELGYRPNEVARSLKTCRSRMVGVVVADLSNSFFMQFVGGLEAQLSERGFQVLLAAHNDDPIKERGIIEMLLENNVAAIVTTTCQQSGDYFNNLRSQGTPIVLADRTIDGYGAANYVIEDNRASANELVAYAIAMGHRRIAVSKSELMYIGTSFDRYMGYVQALEAYGIPLDPRYVWESKRGGVYDCVKDKLQTIPRGEWPTAIFTINNARTEEVLRVLLELGIDIPRTISLLSYGDIQYEWMLNLRITHIKQDTTLLGQLTAKLVIDKITGKSVKPEILTMRSKLVEGNTLARI